MRAEQIGVISVFDPAIDTQRVPLPVWGEYARTRNTALLMQYVIPGKKPTVYHIREIPRSVYFSFVRNAPNAAAEAMNAFMVGVERIDNLEQPDGSYVNWQPPRDPGYETIRYESLDRIRTREIEEIGEVCKQHSDFRLSTEVSFHLGPSLADQWGDFHARRAVASPSSPASNNDAASKVEASAPSVTAATERPSAPSETVSANRTDATATASAP